MPFAKLSHWNSPDVPVFILAESVEVISGQEEGCELHMKSGAHARVSESYEEVLAELQRQHPDAIRVMYCECGGLITHAEACGGATKCMGCLGDEWYKKHCKPVT